VRRATVRDLLVVALLAAGCQSATPEQAGRDAAPDGPMGETTDDVPVDGSGAHDSLRLSLDVPAQVARGTTVPMTVRIENLTDRPLDLYLTGRTIAFDLIVEDRTGTVVWRRLHDEAIQQILRVERLAPGDTLALEHEWEQRSNAGDPVAAGTYTVRGEVLTEDEPLVTPEETLRIAPG